MTETGPETISQQDRLSQGVEEGWTQLHDSHHLLDALETVRAARLNGAQISDEVIQLQRDQIEADRRALNLAQQALELERSIHGVQPNPPIS